MNNPLVSIIIPNYNHSQFLDERILYLQKVWSYL